MENLNLLFNKSYFSGIEKCYQNKQDGNTRDETAFKEHLKDCNRQICSVVFSQEDYHDLDESISPKAHRFLMKTSYPGLLVGTGYAHEVEKGADDCVKLGFSFDYVTGQPYIPGSSVKGMLKSCFEESDDGKAPAVEVLQGVLTTDAETSEESQKELEKSIKDVLPGLKKNIFGDQKSDGKDIFFDAVLRCGSRISDPNGREKGNVMALDYITPHGKDPTKPNGRDETKSPTPLMMVKVRPGVIFEFRFQLHDFKAEGLMVTADQKKALFQILIELFGVGAKTNVGYGTLLPADETEARQQLTQTGSRTERNQSAVQQQSVFRDTVQQSVASQPAVPKKKTCPGCQKKNAVPPGKAVCQECEDKARKTGKCPIFGCKNKNAPQYGSDIFCLNCKRKYDP